MLNMSSVADVFLGISGKYSEQLFLKNTFRWAFHISLNESTSLSAFDDATLKEKKKKLVEVNPPQGWLWKQNGTTVMAAVMIFEVVNNRKSVSQINILIKRTLNPNHLPLQEIYITIIILRWLVSTWRICSKEISEVKHLKLSDYLNQI